MGDAGVGWIAAIIIGGIAGWLAEQFMKSSMGLIMNIVLGIVGAAIASAILSYFGIALGGWIGYLISGFIGAVLLIWIVRAVECAPGAGQVEVSDLTGVLGFRKMKAMARQQRSHSIEFKRQVVQEYIAGETLYGLAKRHDLSRQLIRVWVEKYEAGGLDADAQAADLLHEYETKIVALERMVGRQALEIEFLKGALKNAPRPRSATTSVIAGPTASPSQKDAG
jgi:uncharacterized membrane protein YeaQ/YmgE (transglycosylase-associated protein family)/transposase-like protein